MKLKPSELSDSQLADILSYGSEGLERYGIELLYEDTGPGKFEGTLNPGLAQAIYERSLEGWADDQRGSVPETGWHGCLMGRFILGEDSQGFVYLDEFDSTTEAHREFQTYE